MRLKPVQKKQLLGRHNKDVKHLCKIAIYLLLENAEAATGGVL